LYFCVLAFETAVAGGGSEAAFGVKEVDVSANCLSN
jgi:hypothetical protein